MLIPVNPTIAVCTPAGPGYILLVSHCLEDPQIYLMVSIIETEELLWFNTEDILLPQYLNTRLLHS